MKTEETGRRRGAPAWPLALIAASAFVAIWAGWVGLGRMTGFGEVVLLPGIADHWVINSAITLPLGMEAYAAYALRVWLAPPAGLSRLARRYAACSALGALALGAAGQVTYHLMQAAGLTAAPWQITTFVSCLPVVVLAAAAALYHLVHNVREELPAVEQAADAATLTPLLRAEAAAERPATDQDATKESPADETGETKAADLDQAALTELAACESKAECLQVAWNRLGVVGVPATTDVMPAVNWLAEHGVRVDRSRAYGVRRGLEHARRAVQTRSERLALVGGER